MHFQLRLVRTIKFARKFSSTAIFIEAFIKSTVQCLLSESYNLGRNLETAPNFS